MDKTTPLKVPSKSPSPITDSQTDAVKPKPSDVDLTNVRSLMFALITICIFCLAVLFGPPEAILPADGDMAIPIANIKVRQGSFLYFGPMIVIFVCLYTYMFVFRVLLNLKERKEYSDRYIFTMENLPARVTTNFIFFWLPAIVVVAFVFKALPRPESTNLLGFAMAFLLLILSLRLLLHFYPKYRMVVMMNVVFFPAILSGLVLIGSSDEGWWSSARGWLNDNRPLMLAKVDLKNRDLRGVDISNAKAMDILLPGANLQRAILNDATFTNGNFFDADLREAKLNRTQLGNANLEIADLRAAELRGANLTGANLRDAKLQKADLRALHPPIAGNRTILVNADLDGAFLNEANLSGAALHGASLPGTVMDDAILVGSKLTGVDLSDSSLKRADLRCSKLYDSDLARANLQDAKLGGVDFEGANLNNAILENAYFDCTKCSKYVGHKIKEFEKTTDNKCSNLTNANLNGANLKESKFQGAILIQADLQKANLMEAVLRDVNLTNANLQGADLYMASLEGAALQGASFRDVRLQKTTLRETDIDGTDFTAANLSGADLRGARGLTCEQLERAKNWEKAFRDIPCGANIPPNPESEIEVR